jgi:hypothetical protein
MGKFADTANVVYRLPYRLQQTKGCSRLPYV